MSLEGGGRCSCSAVSRHKKIPILHTAYQEISMIYVYVEASLFSLLCLFSFFVPLSRMFVYMCSVVNIGKVISIIRHKEGARVKLTSALLWVITQ